MKQVPPGVSLQAHMFAVVRAASYSALAKAVPPCTFDLHMLPSLRNETSANDADA